MARKKSYITEQAKRLSAGEINRRRFVMQALSTGVTLPTAMSLASRAQAMTPRKGGLFRHATRHGSALDKLDPAASANGFTEIAIFTRGNHLTEVDRKGQLTGELAASFEASDDAKTWAFTLRPDITFHNGQTLTADDVIATFNRFRRGLLEDITDIRKDTDHQVVITLTQGDTGFARRTADARLMILPSENGEIADTNTPIGTGPYILQSFRPGEAARFIRNPNYWKSGAAHFDEVYLLSVPKTSARHHAILNGDVDYADTINPNAVALIQTMPTLDMFEVKGSRGLRLSVEGAANADLRLALSHAIWRQQLVDQVLLGHGRIGDDTPHPPMEALTCRFDPTKAAAYFQKSGHIGPIKLSSSEAEFPGATHAARLIAASAAEAGITVEATDQIPTSSASRTLIPIWANDIAAHSKALAHTAQSATNFENDGNKIAERWWFA